MKANRVSTPIRLLIVDEHPIVRQGLSALFAETADIDVVAEVDNVPAFKDAFRKHRPDIVLLDLCFKRTEIAQAVTEIRIEFTTARFIIFTTFEGQDEVLMTVQAKMNGYLLKTAPPEEILEAIRSVYRGEKWISSRLALKLGHAAGEPVLSEREQEVLMAVASGKSNQAVAATLFISEGTVKFHINNILTKLGASDRTEAVVIGLHRGILRLSER